MAGNGTRMAGYNKSKPLVDIFGQPMIGLVLENLLFTYDEDAEVDASIIGCVRKEDKELIEFLGSTTVEHIVLVDKLTSGPAATCLLAKSLINDNTSLIVTNSDQIIKDFDLARFLKYCEGYDAVLGTFFSRSSKNSYVRLDDEGLAIEVKEKEAISEHALNGCHYWARGSDFVRSTEEMIGSGHWSKDGEHYVSETFNYLIKEGKRVGVFSFNEHYPLGIPSDLEFFKKKFPDKESLWR